MKKEEEEKKKEQPPNPNQPNPPMQVMPKGPPPYPVKFKEFMVTDPRTGKKTMKI